MSAPSTAVVIPFALVGAEQNPNAMKLAASEQLAAYARGAAVTFASLHRWNPEIDLVWFTNGPVPPALQPVIELLGVQVVTAPFEHEPPEGYMSAFKGCLYMLDALAAPDDRSVLYLDPDVVAVRPLDAMLAQLGDRVGVLSMGFPKEESVNGLTWAMAADYARRHDLPPFEGFLGGEAIWIPAAQRRGLYQTVDVLHTAAIGEFEQGELHPTTEEHLFSLALSGCRTASLDAHVRRIWTTSRYRTVRGDEDALTLWHLPSEKDGGFAALYPVVLDLGSWFYTAPAGEFRERVGRAMSLHHRRPKKLLRDVAGVSMNNLVKAVGRVHPGR